MSAVNDHGIFVYVVIVISCHLSQIAICLARSASAPLNPLFLPWIPSLLCRKSTAVSTTLQRKERKKKVAELVAVVVTESSNKDTLKRLDEYTDELHSDLVYVMMDLELLKA